MAPSTWRTRTAVGVSSVKKSGADAGMDRDAESLKHVMASELHGEVTGEPIGRLHNDGFCAVGCQPLQHLGKAGALIDGISTAHGCIVVFAHDGKPRTFGESLDGCSLTLIAVLIGTDIGRARSA